MAHTAIAEPPGFAELTKAEQVRYLQALWDRIAEKPGDLPVPESHRGSRRNDLLNSAAIRHVLTRHTKSSTVWPRSGSERISVDLGTAR